MAFPVDVQNKKGNLLRVSTEASIKDKILRGDIYKYHVSDINYINTIMPSYSNNSIGAYASRGYDSFLAGQATTSNPVAFSCWLWGSVIGIGVFDNTAGFDNANTPDATIVVDGIPYGLRDNFLKVTNPPNLNAVTESETMFYVPRILKQSWHLVTFVLHSPPSGANPFIIYNWFLEKPFLYINH